MSETNFLNETFLECIFAGMDPPRDITVLYVTEESATISWFQPLAPFDYYKMAYQSPKGTSTTS